MCAMRRCPIAMRCSVARRDRDVVDRERADAGDRAADADQRLAEVVQPLDLVLGELEGDRDHRVDALAQQEVLEHARAPRGRRPTGCTGSGRTRAQQRLLRTLEHRREEPAVQERDDDADVARAPDARLDAFDETT